MPELPEERRLITQSELEQLLYRAAYTGHEQVFSLGAHFNIDNIVEIAKSQFPRLEAQVAMHQHEQATILAQLKELERTKRFLIAVAGFCLISCAALIVFAPAGKEGVSYVVAAAITILSLGAIGVQEFRIRTIGVHIEGGQNSVLSGALTPTPSSKSDEPENA